MLRAVKPVVLFDVLGTLVRDPFFEEMPAFFGLSFDAMLAGKDPTAWVEFERGEIEEAEFFRRFFADQRAFDGDAFRAHVRAAYRFVPGMEELLSDLRSAGVAMHVLSNYPTWYLLIEERLGLSRYLPWSFVSCRTGVRKPDREAFLGAARALGVPAGACLFIDDHPANVDAARAAGMPALLFEGAEHLRERLEQERLLGRR